MSRNHKDYVKISVGQKFRSSLGLEDRGALAQGFWWGCDLDLAWSYSHLKAWMGQEYPLPWSFPHMAVGRRPQFLSTVLQMSQFLTGCLLEASVPHYMGLFIVGLSVFTTWQITSPRSSRDRWKSCDTSYSLVSEIVHCHFNSVCWK